MINEEGFLENMKDIVKDISGDIPKAIKTIDQMLRTRKSRMLILDCLAISAVLRDHASLTAKLEKATAALGMFADEENWQGGTFTGNGFGNGHSFAASVLEEIEKGNI
jgi:hypothetical protein